MKTAVNILISISVLAVALSFILAYANTHPPRYPLHLSPSRFKAAYEDVSFVASDNVLLKGRLIRPGRGTTRREIDPDRLGICGFSPGGATAILTAANVGGFKAVVADSAFTSLRDQARTAITGITGFYHLPSFPFLSLAMLGYWLSFFTAVDDVAPEAAIAKLPPVPVLLIAGERDDLVPVENGRRLYAAAGEPKELWLIPVHDHGGPIAAAGSEQEKRVGSSLAAICRERAEVHNDAFDRCDHFS